MLEMAGLHAKRDDDGNLLSFPAIMEKHVAAFEQPLDESRIVSPTSLAAQKNVRNTKLYESYVILYPNWLEELRRGGVPMERLPTDITEDASESLENNSIDAVLNSTAGYLVFFTIGTEIIAAADALVDALETSNDVTRPNLLQCLKRAQIDLTQLCSDRYGKDDDKMIERDDFAPAFTRIARALKPKEPVGKIDKVSNRRSATGTGGETGRYYRR